MTRVAAAPTPLKIEDGHVSPLMARITYPSGKVRNVTIAGTGFSSWDPFRVKGYGEGDADVILFLDSIKEMRYAGKDQTDYIFKNGGTRRLKANVSYSKLLLKNPDGGEEQLPFSGVKSVVFLKPARQDKAGHAMLDEWQYSPYTGEKLAAK